MRNRGERENRRLGRLSHTDLLIFLFNLDKAFPVPAWWNGRHNRLKICRSKGHASSSLAAGTTQKLIFLRIEEFFLNTLEKISTKFPPEKTFYKKL